MRVDVLGDIADADINDDAEEMLEKEFEMDDGFEFDLKKDELEAHLAETELVDLPSESESSPGGLEKLKYSGLENEFAESRFVESSSVDQDEKTEISPIEQDEDTEQKVREGLTEIDLEHNDFEDPVEVWTSAPDTEQTLREGLTDIRLDHTDFKPIYPENISSFDGPVEISSQGMDISEDVAETYSELDDYELPQSTDENELKIEIPFDNLVLTDSAGDDFDLDFNFDPNDVEINSMVNDSLNDQEDNEESALGELEELSEQMEALEFDETQFEEVTSEVQDEVFESWDDAKNEFMSFPRAESDLKKEEIDPLAIATERSKEADVDSEEYLTDIMQEELDNLLEEEDVLDSKDGSESGIVKELEEMENNVLDDLKFDDAKFQKEKNFEGSLEVQEEVFDNWNEAEDAFINFDRQTVLEGKKSSLDEIDGIVFDKFDEDFESSESYRFTEKELKEIVAGSVHKALEKSIASSLVELAVSELKSQVAQMDQS